jgi:prepilin-type processing-associated H-X9-DG protein
MWHGGTLNYLFWGGFHGVCYYVYVKWVKRRHVNRGFGILAMLMFFVFGRMLAIDADIERLCSRMVGFLDPTRYEWQFPTDIAGSGFFASYERNALIVAAVFIGAEMLSRRLYGTRAGYHLMRRPVFSLALLLAFLVFGIDTGTLLYARI